MYTPQQKHPQTHSKSSLNDLQAVNELSEKEKKKKNTNKNLYPPPPQKKQQQPKQPHTHKPTTNTPKPCCRSLCKGIYSDGPPTGKGLAGMGGGGGEWGEGGNISWSNWNDTSVLLLSQSAWAESSVRLGKILKLFHSLFKKKDRNIYHPPPPPPPHTHTNPKNKTITNNKQNHSVHISPFNQYETSNYSTEKMVCKMSVLTTTRWGTGFQSNGRQ